MLSCPVLKGVPSFIVEFIKSGEKRLAVSIYSSLEVLFAIDVKMPEIAIAFVVSVFPENHFLFFLDA